MKNKSIENINKLITEMKLNENISTKKISDGHHTFNDLYEQRTILFCVICNSYSELSWKSKKHFNNEIDPMYKNDFIAGIKTPLGDACYHINLKYWDKFVIPELEKAPKYDGHNSEDDLIRLLSLVSKN